MDADVSLSSGEQFPLQWSWDVQQSMMSCSEPLPKLLGCPDPTALTLARLLAAVDISQRDDIKKLVRQAYQKHSTHEARVIINIDTRRFVALLCVWSDEQTPTVIQGTFEVLMPLPSSQLEHQLLQYALAHAQLGVLILDDQQRILYVNEKFCVTTGFRAYDLIGVSAELFGTHDDDPQLYQKIWQMVHKKGRWRGELLARDQQGLTFAHELIIQRIQLSAEQGTFYIALSKRLDASMTQVLSAEDNETVPDESLSKLPSPSEFKDRLQRLFEQLPGDRTMVVFAFQAFFSKNISQSMSHWLIGNRLLELPNDTEVGVLTKDLFAGVFVVPRNLGMIHHTLQILLSQMTGASEVLSDANDIDVNINIGVSILGTDAVSVSQLLSHSSQALVGNRNRELSTISYFDNRLQKRMDRKQILSRLLDKAITNNNINVFYQPILDVRSLKITKFEALFRVQLDTKIPYDTQELIDLAEEFGWIDRIDLAVTRKGLTDIVAIQNYYKDPDIQLSVNRSMRNDRLSHCCLEDTLEIITDARINPKLVTVELTESSFLADTERQMIWIEKLKEQGIEIAIDDFGTGYSSLSYLLNLPINIIKIDRSFVMNLTMGSNAYMMIEMVASLVHRMGGKVVAEGVETPEILHMISLAKVDYVQGYLFSKPVSLETITCGEVPLHYMEYQDHIASIDAACARDIMLREFPKITLDHKLGGLVDEMREHHRSFWVVIEEGKCCGILRDTDINAAISPYLATDNEQQRDRLTLNRRVHQILHRDNFETIPMDGELGLVAHLLQNAAKPFVIVTGDMGGCVGLITPDILLQHIN